MSTAEQFPAIQSNLSSIDEGFFKPISYSAIEQLLWQHKAAKSKIEQLHAFVNSEAMKSAINYFLRAGDDEHRNQRHSSAFGNQENAIKILDCDFWERALKLTDIWEHMPQKRRDQWRENIDNREVPAFEADIVIDTLKSLLLARDSFLAERVDGLFHSLSGEHLTNVPEGFYRRMVLYVAEQYSGGLTSISSSKVGYLHDLRVIIAKFMGRTPGHYGNTYDIVKRLYDEKRTGEWQAIDGGALRIKVFKKGTAHLEVNEDISWRLNAILAFLYPRAIPAQFRTRPKKSLKKFSYTQNLIPGDVINILASVENDYIFSEHGHQRTIVGRSSTRFRFTHYTSSSADKHVLEKASAIMEACGGKRASSYTFEFDYPFSPILSQILAVGSIPDHIAHQYYPTPSGLAKELVEWCDIDETHDCLEPSAGQGAIAQFMPLESTLCIEISALHCSILKQKGFQAIHEDFLDWSIGAEQVDRIVANAPFSQGRAEAHLHAAANLLKKGGVLTALVPLSLRNKTKLTGFSYEWAEIEANEFPGVSIELAKVRLIRQ